MERECQQTVEFTALESFADSETLNSKLNLLNGKCSDEKFIVKVLSVLERSPLRCVNSNTSGATIADFRFKALCLFLNPGDVIVVKIISHQYNKYICENSYVTAHLNIDENFKIGDLVPIVIGDRIYYNNQNSKITAYSNTIFKQDEFPTNIYKIYDTKDIPRKAQEAIAELHKLINNLLEKANTTEFAKTRDKYLKQKKFKTKPQSALTPKYEEHKELYFIYSLYTPIEKAQYFLVPTNVDLEEFKPYEIKNKNEPHYERVIHTLHTTLDMLNMIYDFNNFKN